MDISVSSAGSTKVTHVRAKANAIVGRFRDILKLLFVMLSAKRFTNNEHPALIFFSDHADRHLFSFNNLFSLSVKCVEILGRSGPTMVLFIATQEGYDFARGLKLAEVGRLVVYVPSHCEYLGKWHGELRQAITYPVPAFIGTLCRVNANLQIRPLYLYLLIVYIWIIGFSLGGYFPKDDLLRHAIAYQWGYEYSVPYTNIVHSPPFDLYVGFDHMIGALHRVLGDNTLAVSQLMSITLTFWAAARFLNGTDNNLRLVLLAAIFSMLMGRFTLGRPSLLCSSIMLILIAYDDAIKPAVKIGASILMGMMYYLFFLYTIPLIIVDRKYIVGLLFSLVFWLTYAGSTYFAEIHQVIHSISLQNMDIGENKTIFAFLAGIWIFAVPWLLYWRRDPKKTLVTIFFLLTNQVRYIESAVPLIIGFFRYTKLRIPGWIALGAIFFIMVQGSFTIQNLNKKMAKMIPAGSTVLTEDMKTMYRLLYFNPTIHISPSYSYGWTDPRAQSIIKDIFTGKLDCNNSFLYSYEYLVEDHLIGTPPLCLKLLGTEGEKRLWMIKKEASSSTVN